MDEPQSKQGEFSAETEEKAQQTSEKKYTVRHNKTDVQLTLDELIKNAEKGLDYDRIRPSHDFVKLLASKYGESDVSRFIAKMKNELEGETPAAGSQPERGAADDKEKQESEMIAREYPEYIKDGTVQLPPDVLKLHQSGMSRIEACRLYDLKRTKELCERLSAKLEALEANRANASASIGSLSGGDVPEKDFYTSQEWDRLPQKQKEKFIKNGKIYEFMKKWGGR